MFIGYQQVAVTGALLTRTDLVIPANATSVILQADTNNIRYTMDGSNPTQVRGMVLVAGLPPEEFLIENLYRIRFTRGAAADAVLNLHYSGSQENYLPDPGNLDVAISDPFISGMSQTP
jgi:hypothetical protein